jgi:hypothetical protein
MKGIEATRNRGINEMQKHRMPRPVLLVACSVQLFFNQEQNNNV